MEISLKPAQQKNRTKKWINKNGNWMVLFSGLIVLMIWYVITVWSDLPAFILPSPLMIWNTFVETLLNGTLIRHFSITLLEVLLGLTAGSVMATTIGYLAGKITHIGENPLTISGSQPGDSNRCDCTLAGDLVRTGIVFKSPDRCINCVFPSPG